jgi:hypothetical protein
LDIDLRALAVHADVIVEAIVADPAHVEVKRVGVPGCPEHAVGVYRIDILEVRKAPDGVDVPDHIDVLDPGDIALAHVADAACAATPAAPEVVASYPSKLAWGPGKEVVVLLMHTGDTWTLAAESAWDPINRADKIARWAGVRAD